MAFRNSHSGSGVEDKLDVLSADKRCISLFPALIGLLAVMNVASVVFVLIS
jgi:hypothetical protein